MAESFTPTTKIGKAIDLIAKTMTVTQQDRWIALGVELALIVGDAVVTELRSRYFAAHPDRQWLTDPTTIEVE